MQIRLENRTVKTVSKQGKTLCGMVKQRIGLQLKRLECLRWCFGRCFVHHARKGVMLNLEMGYHIRSEIVHFLCDFVDCWLAEMWNDHTNETQTPECSLHWQFGYSGEQNQMQQLARMNKNNASHIVQCQVITFVVLPNWTTAIVENDRLQVHVAQIGIVAACVAADLADGTRRWPLLLIAPNRPAGRKHVRLIEATECGIENLIHKLYGRYSTTIVRGLAYDI